MDVGEDRFEVLGFWIALDDVHRLQMEGMSEAMPNAVEVGEIGEGLHIVERIEHLFGGGIAGTGKEEGASAAQDGFADLQSPTFGRGRGDAFADLRDGELAEPFAEGDLLLWCELTEERGGALLAFDEVDAPLGSGIDGLRRWRGRPVWELLLSSIAVTPHPTLSPAGRRKLRR